MSHSKGRACMPLAALSLAGAVALGAVSPALAEEAAYPEPLATATDTSMAATDIATDEAALASAPLPAGEAAPATDPGAQDDGSPAPAAGQTGTGQAGTTTEGDGADAPDGDGRTTTGGEGGSVDGPDAASGAADAKPATASDATGTADEPTGGTDADAESEEDAPFVDVTDTTSHATDIDWLASEGISTGWKRADGTREFRPNAAIARGDMAAFLYRLAGSPDFDETSVATPFADVSPSTAHFKEILWLAASGISEGWARADGTREFRPNAAIARGDMAAFLYRLAGEPAIPADAEGFTDVSTTTSHWREILWLSSEGISRGWTDEYGMRTFRPNASVRRGDMAAFLHRQDEADDVAPGTNASAGATEGWVRRNGSWHLLAGTTSTTAQDVITVAAGEVGHTGGGKYWQAMGYDYDDSNAPSWCCIGLAWAFRQAGLDIGTPINCGTSSAYGIQYALMERAGATAVSAQEARTGDVVIFDFNKGDEYLYEHVGIVTANDGSRLSTVEFNVSDSVGRRTRPYATASVILRPTYARTGYSA